MYPAARAGVPERYAPNLSPHTALRLRSSTSPCRNGDQDHSRHRRDHVATQEMERSTHVCIDASGVVLQPIRLRAPAARREAHPVRDMTQAVVEQMREMLAEQITFLDREAIEEVPKLQMSL